MQRRCPAKVPLIGRELRREGRLLSHLEAFGPLSDRDQQRGRFAAHDRIAMCLLRKDIESALPARREISITRNRRRLKVIFILCILWWIAGRFLL